MYNNYTKTANNMILAFIIIVNSNFKGLCHEKVSVYKVFFKNNDAQTTFARAL